MLFKIGFFLENHDFLSQEDTKNTLSVQFQGFLVALENLQQVAVIYTLYLAMSLIVPLGQVLKKKKKQNKNITKTIVYGYCLFLRNKNLNHLIFVYYSVQ